MSDFLMSDLILFGKPILIVVRAEGSLLKIVVSLTCTTYHWESLIAWQMALQILIEHSKRKVVLIFETEK